jgi:hypothetical protein
VPHASSPRSARRRAPGTASKIHAIFVAEKYGSTTSPVCFRTASPRAERFSFAQRSAVRRHCQTTAGWIGRPVARSQTTTVSRWFVTPTAAISSVRAPAATIARRAHARVVAHSSSGSCST